MMCQHARHKMSSQETRQIKSIVGENIRSARDEKGMTQRALADAVNGLDSVAVSRWERGVVMPSMVSLVRLAEVLERDVSWFYVDRAEAAA